MSHSLPRIASYFQWIDVLRGLEREVDGGAAQATSGIQLAVSAALVDCKEIGAEIIVGNLLSAARQFTSIRGKDPCDACGLVPAAFAFRSSTPLPVAVEGWITARNHVSMARLAAGGFPFLCSVLCAQTAEIPAHIMSDYADLLDIERICSKESGCRAAMALLACADEDPPYQATIVRHYADALQRSGISPGTTLLTTACVLSVWHERKPLLMERYEECVHLLGDSRIVQFYAPAVALLAISPIRAHELVPHVVSLAQTHGAAGPRDVSEAGHQALAAFIARQDLDPVPSAHEVAAFLAVMACASAP